MVRIPGLACPGCRIEMEAEGDATLICRQCEARWPVLDGIPSFVPAPPTGRQDSLYQLTVLVPVVTGGVELDRLLAALHAELRSLEITHELMVADAGQTAAVEEIADRHDALYIRVPTSGYGAALRAGFDRAVGEYVLTVDPDGSHDPSFLRAMWPARTAAEVVIASRYAVGGRAQMPAARRVLSRLLNRILRRGLSLPYTDLSSGYRLYRRSALQSISYKAERFDILQEILIRMVAEGYRITEVPFDYRPATASTEWLARFAVSHLKTFAAMWKLRNSILSADYDARAYDSIVPLQRYWQRRRYAVITRMARGSQRILDVGCGSSRIIGSGRLIGVDIVLAKLRYARRFGNPLVHGSIYALPFRDSAFDCVICSEVIEHLPAEEQIFDELERVLEPGGLLILGTPDYDRRRWRALEWLYGRLAPGGYADEHITHYSRTNLAAYLRGRNLTIEAVDYVGGSEMVFKLRRSVVSKESRTLPVTAGLRGQAARSSVSGA